MSWHDAVTVQPGEIVVVRMRVELLNASPNILGFGGLTCQPTVSNWLAANGDTRLPFTSPDGSGVPDLPGNYGRILPHSSVRMDATSAAGLLTSFNDPGNTLRFAGARNTSPTLNLAWGVNLARLTQSPFSLNSVVFKYAVIPGASTGDQRALIANMPVTTAQNSRVVWFTSLNGADSYQYTLSQSDIVPATITVVPQPGVFAIFVLAVLVPHRRRRGVQ